MLVHDCMDMHSINHSQWGRSHFPKMLSIGLVYTTSFIHGVQISIIIFINVSCLTVQSYMDAVFFRWVILLKGWWRKALHVVWIGVWPWSQRIKTNSEQPRSKLCCIYICWGPTILRFYNEREGVKPRLNGPDSIERTTMVLQSVKVITKAIELW